MSRLTWYARRLTTMSPAEIGWRVGTIGRTSAERLLPPRSDRRILGVADPDWVAARDAFRQAAGRPVLLDRAVAQEIAATHPDETAALLAAADRVVAGRVRYFGYPEARLGDPVDWNHDPVSGVTWPRIPAARLDHRSAAGDAKWIWELNRLQHLPWLAQAWLVTGEPRYAETAWAHLDSWIAQNPPGEGIAWRGAFEAGIRAVSVAVAVQGLRDSAGLTASRYRAVATLLAESARRCWADRSRFSSANNHLVGELAGLAVIALLFPELAGAERDLRRALDALAAQAGLQILPDGAGAEQAFAYQLFTADLLLVVAALLRKAGRPVPQPVTDALRRSAGYLAALVGRADPAPRYGDDDEGFALRLDAAELPDVRSHLAAVAAVTGDTGAAAFGRAGLTSAWLGGQAAAAPEPAPEPAGMHAPDGGLVVLRAGGRRVTMDVGPLGFLAIAAHGHADALAVTLAVDGQELVGDPGAGSYYGHPPWRTVHRSTRAHATVEVDGLDQSVAGGAFLWTRHAAVTLHRVDLARGIVDAEHDGYTRLDRPVRHRRWLLAPPAATSLLVVDLLTGSGHHEVRTAWPLHPRLAVAPDGAGHVATIDGAPVLRLLHAATAQLRREEVRGDEAGGLGWWSDRLEAREPAWLVGAGTAGEMPLAVATLLHVPGAGPAPENLTVTAAGGAVGVGWQEGAERRSVTVDPNGSGIVTESLGSPPPDR